VVWQLTQYYKFIHMEACTIVGTLGHNKCVYISWCLLAHETQSEGHTSNITVSNTILYTTHTHTQLTSVRWRLLETHYKMNTHILCCRLLFLSFQPKGQYHQWTLTLLSSPLDPLLLSWTSLSVFLHCFLNIQPQKCGSLKRHFWRTREKSRSQCQFKWLIELPKPEEVYKFAKDGATSKCSPLLIVIRVLHRVHPLQHYNI
jgi:hypothetical protein